MARKPYYTLCIWHEAAQTFLDHFGDYSRKAVEEEIEWVREYEPKDWFRIVKHDGSAEDMIAKRDALAPPKNPGKPAFMVRK